MKLELFMTMDVHVHVSFQMLLKQGALVATSPSPGSAFTTTKQHSKLTHDDAAEGAENSIETSLINSETRTHESRFRKDRGMSLESREEKRLWIRNERNEVEKRDAITVSLSTRGRFILNL